MNSLGKSTQFAPTRLLPREVALKRAKQGPGGGSKRFFDDVYDYFAQLQKATGSAEMTGEQFVQFMTGLFIKHEWQTQDAGGDQRPMNEFDARQLFEAFDEDKSGSIDFQEVIQSFEILRLKMTFQ